MPFNAAQGTVLPNIERTPPTPLTDAQIIKFFERIKYHEKRDIFIFALLTGLSNYMNRFEVATSSNDNDNNNK